MNILSLAFAHIMKTPNWFLKKNFIAYLLLPFSFVYKIFSKLVFFIKGRAPLRSKIPVICIGGIMAGGVGKTPIVREIAKRLNAPVVMRGYNGTRNSRLGTRVLSSDSAIEVGDEAKMLSKDLNIYVGDRRLNIQTINRVPCNAIVLDDGFQNPTVHKDISILVFDGRLGIGNGFLLPAGPLRETLHDGISRADAVIIIGSNDLLKSDIQNIKNIPVFAAKTHAVRPKIRGRVIGFAGLGYPEKFHRTLKVLDFKVEIQS
ncbi:tetraacyldisaccharide 4'-kinase [Bacteroidia bacterium]|nr:tetraacyldisaccharide 4'-kinase [Bacteroidia bacterium]